MQLQLIFQKCLHKNAIILGIRLINILYKLLDSAENLTRTASNHKQLWTNSLLSSQNQIMLFQVVQLSIIFLLKLYFFIMKFSLELSG